MMSSTILSFFTGLVTRLAATIPSNNDSSNDTTIAVLSQLLTDLSKPQSLQDLFVLTIIVVIALEILNQLVYHVPTILSSINTSSNNDEKKKKKSTIPVRGKHLDHFTIKDYTFIMINKCMTGLFVYCYFGYLWSVRKPQQDDTTTISNDTTISRVGGHGIFTTNNLTIQNTLFPLPLLFLTYDFFYTLLHWFLHIKSIYVYIHKHHHFQKAPSRANIDAVNVHPLEFFLGEFNHILALMLVVKGVPPMVEGGYLYRGMDVSWVGAVLFIGVGGVLAGLNHTRHDVVLSVPTTSGVSSTSADASLETEDTSSESSSSSASSTSNDKQTKQKSKGYLTIFDSKHHDVHHRIPQSNYGQYTVFWDRVFGTFRDYDENDRVNPAYQLDPMTGKTVVVKSD